MWYHRRSEGVLCVLAFADLPFAWRSVSPALPMALPRTARGFAGSGPGVLHFRWLAEANHGASGRVRRRTSCAAAPEQRGRTNHHSCKSLRITHSLSRESARLATGRFSCLSKNKEMAFEREEQGSSRGQGPPRIGSASVRKSRFQAFSGFVFCPYGKIRARKLYKKVPRWGLFCKAEAACHRALFPILFGGCCRCPARWSRRRRTALPPGTPGSAGCRPPCGGRRGAPSSRWPPRSGS